MIYFVRHGQTTNNAAFLLGGDSDLSELGHEQADQAAEIFKDTPLDVIFVSTYKRTLQTAQHINKYHNVPILADARLKERYFGDLELSDERTLNLKQIWDLNNEQLIPKVETISDLIARVTDFLQYLKTNYPNKNILIVSHRGLGRFFEYAHGKRPASGNLLDWGLNNGEYYTYEN